jgi:hypothetical protein
MDEILAINTRRRGGLYNTENFKRNAVQDKIIKANDGKLISSVAKNSQ